MSWTCPGLTLLGDAQLSPIPGTMHQAHKAGSLPSTCSSVHRCTGSDGAMHVPTVLPGQHAARVQVPLAASRASRGP